MLKERVVGPWVMVTSEGKLHRSLDNSGAHWTTYVVAVGPCLWRISARLTAMGHAAKTHSSLDRPDQALLVDSYQEDGRGADGALGDSKTGKCDQYGASDKGQHLQLYSVLQRGA